MEWIKKLVVIDQTMIFAIINATLETLYMVLVSGFFALILGTAIGIFLSVTKTIMPSPKLHKITSTIVNTSRSFPFIILIILLLPLSKFIIGQSYGTTAAIVPLSLSAAPFVARLIEGALDEVDKGLIEATQSMGGGNLTIIAMMISQGLPTIINAITITLISLVGYSAIAGAIGAGGLGDLAIRLGYATFMPNVLFWTVITIIVMVQIIQSAGDYLVRKIRKNR